MLTTNRSRRSLLLAANRKVWLHVRWSFRRSLRHARADDFIARLLSLLRARHLDDRLDQELRAHLQFALEENVARGMTPEAARAAAMRSIGGVMQTPELWRETRGFPSLTATDAVLTPPRFTQLCCDFLITRSRRA